MKVDTHVNSDKTGTQIRSSVIIKSPITEVWDVVKFPDKISEFHPLVKRSYLITTTQHGIGVKRHCDLLPMGAMDEVVTEWNEEKSFVTEVVGGKMLPPFHFMKGELALEKVDAETTKVTFSFSYRLRFGTIGRLMDNLAVRPQFKKAPPKYMLGLKAYIEASQQKAASL